MNEAMERFKAAGWHARSKGHVAVHEVWKVETEELDDGWHAMLSWDLDGCEGERRWQLYSETTERHDSESGALTELLDGSVGPGPVTVAQFCGVA